MMSWFKQLLIGIVSVFWESTILITLAVYYYLEAIINELTPTFLRTQKSLRDKVVIITGGAGGVGQELAIRLARIQARVVVWDINKEAIQKIHERCDKEGYKIYSYVVDITDRNNIYKNAELVKKEVGAVDIVINNAAIVSGYTLLDIPDELIEKSFQINIISQYWMAKAFLGDMIKRGKGHIVSIGSLTGLLGTYKCTDYSATKYALTGLHESLLTELKAHGHNNIHVTLICPYFIKTGMFDGCKPRTMSMLDPKDVAKRIITAVKREEVFVTMPGFIRFLIPIKQYIPAKLNWLIMNRIFRGPQSMMGIKSLENIKTDNSDVAAA